MMCNQLQRRPNAVAISNSGGKWVEFTMSWPIIRQPTQSFGHNTTAAFLVVPDQNPGPDYPLCHLCHGMGPPAASMRKVK